MGEEVEEALDIPLVTDMVCDKCTSVLGLANWWEFHPVYFPSLTHYFCYGFFTAQC